MIIFVDYGPPVMDPRPAWVPQTASWLSLRQWNDLRPKATAAEDLTRRHVRPGDVVVLLGDRVREAFRLPRLFFHPVVRDGAIFRQLPSLKVRPFYADYTIRSILEELVKCQTAPARTESSQSEPRSPRP